MKSLAQQRVVVIGGSSGIGRVVAREAGAQGARLLITGRDPRKLAAAAEQLGAADIAVLDAHDEAALDSFLDTLADVDHLVSMVGDSMAGGFLTTSRATLRHVLQSKFYCNWVIGSRAAKKLSDGGSLTFTAGTGGRAHDVSASYVANLGIGALVQGLAAEVAPRLRVNAVAPTFMGAQTAFWRDMPSVELETAQAAFSASIPLQRVGTVEEVASAYIYLMTNGFITGQVLPVDGGVMLRK